MSRWDLSSEVTLSTLVDSWLEDSSGQIDPETADLYRLHVKTHLEPHFKTPHAITKSSIADYCRARLKKVRRRTLQKERSTLRGLLAWCHEQGYLPEPPEFPALPKKAQGTAWHQRRRGRATPLSPDECRALIQALPQWSTPRGKQPAFAVRARFALMFETALRPATLDALSVPEHYQPGGSMLVITDEIDKARFGRDLPLNERARAALDSVAREGLIFGRHDYRHHLERAATKTLDPERARTFTAYDLRHARLTELADKGDLTGVAYLAGHKRITTTGIYVRPGLRAAERALSAASTTPASHRRELAGVGQLHDLIPVGAKKRTRTSTPSRALEPESSGSRPTTHLVAVATSLLERARDGVSVHATELYDFARAALQSQELGRLALAVLDGGAFAPIRAVELARLVIREGEADAADGTEGSGER